MCASYSLKGDVPEITKKYGLDPLSEKVDLRRLGDWLTHGQARITGRIAKNLNPLVRTDDGTRTLDMAWWWIWPSSAGPAEYNAFNARDDKLMGRAWHRLFRSHRAAVPMTSFVEKKRDFALPRQTTFSVAAISNTVTVDGHDLVTYALVTQDTPAHLAHVNPRMPLVLSDSAVDAWLNPAQEGTRALVDHVLAASRPVAEELQVID